MGRLDDRHWWQDLPAEDLRRLDSWLGARGATLGHRGWFRDGRSQQPVGLVVLNDEDTGLSRLVLKICASHEGIVRLGLAWKQSKSPFRDRHLLRLLDTIELHGRWAALFNVAGGNLINHVALNRRADEKDFPEICRHVVASVVDEWNDGILRPPAVSPSVREFLRNLIGKRLAAVYEWARASGVDVNGGIGAMRRPGWSQTLTNPFVLLAGEPADHPVVEDLLVGRAHGDLSGRNVRVPRRGAPDDYVLIDADHFDAEAPLARDPMHLLVALALDRIDSLELGPKQSRDLVKVIVAPRRTDLPASAESFRAVSAAIWEASEQLAARHSYGDPWTEQCLLSVVGVGLLHVGRDLRTVDPVKAREWCFDLAAMAAEAYLAHTDLGDQRDVGPPSDSRTRQPDRGERRGHPAAAAAEGGAGMLDHEGERLRLYSILAGGPWGVVVVHGPAGVGKSMLVKTALADLRLDPSIEPELRVCRHEAWPGTRFDVKTLIDDIAGGAEPAAAIRFGESSLTRLTATLEAVGDRRVVITIDAAEHLVNKDTRELVDLDLDEALETLANISGHRVCVVFVSREAPASSFGGTWPTAIPPILLPKLPFPHFLSFLARLDRGQHPAVSTLDESDLEELYRRLEGNPRRAELLHAVLTLTDNGGPAALVRQLSKRSPAAVAQSLTTMLRDGLTHVRRDALAALAAYGIPVGRDEVVALVDQGRGIDQIQGALDAVATGHLAHRTDDGRYYVPAGDTDWMLQGAFQDRPSPDEERFKFLRRAADELSRFRVVQPQELGDLTFHFAELNALLRARRARLAYPLIREIDRVLEQWNYRHRLLDQREAIVGKLGRRGYELANDNDLGAIYASRGDFARARTAYERAEQYARALGHGPTQAKILVNTATMNWLCNDTPQAAKRYEKARVAARRIHDHEVLMGALEGLADCHRRRGEYQLALRRAIEARSVATAPDYPDAPTAQDFASAHTVIIALKMARWYGELDRLADARTCINLALAAEEVRRDDWLQASCLDGQADLALFEGDLPAAMISATAAIERAARLHDPITLLQARTTMCLAHLLADNPLPAAAREIERAARHRREGRSFIALALQALVARLESRPRDAAPLFEKLLDEATARIERDERDFGAWDYAGFARCGKVLDGGSLDRAVEAFQTARTMTPPTPGLVARLRILVEKLDQAGRRPGRLRPVIELLDETAARRSNG